MTNCAARMEGARIIASLILSGWVVVLLVMGATSGVFLPAMAVFAIGVWRDWPWGWLGAVLMAGLLAYSGFWILLGGHGPVAWVWWSRVSSLGRRFVSSRHR